MQVWRSSQIQVTFTRVEIKEQEQWWCNLRHWSFASIRTSVECVNYWRFIAADDSIGGERERESENAKSESVRLSWECKGDIHRYQVNRQMKCSKKWLASLFHLDTLSSNSVYTSHLPLSSFRPFLFLIQWLLSSQWRLWRVQNHTSIWKTCEQNVLSIHRSRKPAVGRKEKCKRHFSEQNRSSFFFSLSPWLW